MNFVFLILCMIFCHIVDDYKFQGILASMKQKDWWVQEFDTYDDLRPYRYDYIWALIMHSFSWSFMIMLPIMFAIGFELNWLFVMVFVGNVAIHAIVDDAKANDKSINLWQDQLIHLGQILVTAVLYYFGVF